MNKASCLFELVHLDLWGPYKTPSSCGVHYFLTIVDDFSRGVWLYLIRNKMEVELMFLNFVAFIKRQFNKEIKLLEVIMAHKFLCCVIIFLRLALYLKHLVLGHLNKMGELNENINIF